METVLRVAAVYLVLMLFFRITGKRELSQMSSFELVTLLLIPEIVGQALVREDFSITNALVGVATIFTLVIATSILSHRFQGIAEFIEGKPTVLAHNGKLNKKALDLERVQPEEIFGEMHKVGIEELSDVKWAILESDGRIAIIPRRSEFQVKPDKETPV